MKPFEIIRNAIPTASDELCEYILWARTPFPLTFKGGAKTLYKVASGVSRAIANGRTLCEACKNEAMPDNYNCKRCERSLNQN